jgi:menaquinone-9 beta-reductase
MTTRIETESSGHYDVVVVGGRVAGASTALLLARAGHRVAVVERTRFPADTLSTNLIWPAGIVQLRAWGLLPAVARTGAPPLTMIHDEVDDVSLDLPVWPESGVDAVYAPRRRELDALLLDAAASAGADVVDGVTVDGLSRDGRNSIDGVIGHRDGTPVHLTAHIVVGADGWRSGVARAAGATVLEHRPPTNAVHYAYWADLAERGVELWFRSSGRMAGAFPSNDGTCVFVNCPTAETAGLRDDLDTGFRTFLREAAPDLADRIGSAAPGSPIRGTPGLPRIRRTAHGSGWVLVGDAASTTDPASAHGITAALRDAELAARAIDEALRHPTGTRAALAGYEAERDRWRRIDDIAWEMAAYRWDAARLLELQAAFGQELVREAQSMAGLEAWAGASLDSGADAA